MKKIRVITAITIVLIIIFTLAGCNQNKLSGKYVSATDESKYLEFSNDVNVTVHMGNQTVNGVYIIVENFVLVKASKSDTSAIVTMLIKDGNLYDGDDAYVKENFLAKNWWKFLIGLFVLGLISQIFKKITGKDLEETIDSFIDNDQKDNT